MSTVAKRKRDSGKVVAGASAATAAAASNDPEDGGSDVMSPVRLENVENYPRKRVMTACNLCRFRKTKCDAVRPSCGFCTNLGIECEYRDGGNAPPEKPQQPTTKPKLPDRHRRYSKESKNEGLETRVALLESQLREIQSERQAAEIRRWDNTTHGTTTMQFSHHLNSYAPSPGNPQTGVSPGEAISTPMTYNSGDGGPVTSPTTLQQNGYVFRRARTEIYTARPLLLTFCCPPYIDAESWDDYPAFYAGEMQAGEDLHKQFDQLCYDSIFPLPDINRREARQYQASFVDRFLGWMPIFDAQIASDAIKVAYGEIPVSHVGDRSNTNGGVETNHDNTRQSRDISICLAMFTLAIGAITHESAEPLGECRRQTQQQQFETLPGIQFLARACRVLERFAFLVDDLRVQQCRILQAAYFKLALRPIQSWNAVAQVARNCMSMLSSNSAQLRNPAARESWNRAFWACSTILEELEGAAKMHAIGHRAFHELVPLPRFENEDTGFYYFLAQISLRKLVQNMLEVVGYKQGQVILAPVVLHELKSQAQEWYDHLPAAIRFPLTDAPLYDPRKGFLRAQLVTVFIVLEWASVLRVLQLYANGSSAHDHHHDQQQNHNNNNHPTVDSAGSAVTDEEEMAAVRFGAGECLRYCALYFRVAEEPLVSWNLGTHNTLWSMFAFVGKLIICYKHPALSYVPETRDPKHIQDAMTMVKVWEHVPFVARGLSRFSGMMERAGIQIPWE